MDGCSNEMNTRTCVDWVNLSKIILYNNNNNNAAQTLYINRTVLNHINSEQCYSAS